MARRQVGICGSPYPVCGNKGRLANQTEEVVCGVGERGPVVSPFEGLDSR